jgi:hypothetical protein
MIFLISKEILSFGRIKFWFDKNLPIKMTFNFFDIPEDVISSILLFCEKKTLKSVIFTNKELYSIFKHLRSENLTELRLWYLNQRKYQRTISKIFKM